MKPTPHKYRSSVAALMTAFAALSAHGQIAFDGSTKTENFDSMLSATVTGAFSTTVGTQGAIPNLSGWSGVRAVAGGSSLAPDLIASNGSGSSGAIYNFGTTTDRALGVVASGSNTMAIGAEFTNTSGGTITSITIGFTSEFWRSSTSTKNSLTFAYGFSGGTANSTNYLTEGSLNTFGALNVIGPDSVTSNGLLDGNAALNRAVVAPVTINGINWAPNTSLFIRWTDFNDVGNDAGLAIDDFSISGIVNSGSDVPHGATGIWTANSFAGAPFTANDTAVFGTTPTTINTSGAVIASALKFNANGYLVSPLTDSNTDTLQVTGAITVGSETDSATIESVLVGSSGITKIGAGTLYLTGANTFTGNISVSGGRLGVSFESGLGDPENDIALSGGMLDLGSIGSLGAGHAITGTGTVNYTSGLSINAPLGASALTFSGNGALFLSGTTNAPTTLTLGNAVALNVVGGALTPSSGLIFAQTSGIGSITGPVNFGTSAKNFEIRGGRVDITGLNGSTFTTGNRIIKIGAGALDLTSSTLTASGTNGGFRLGVQGATPLEGGRIIIDEASDLGTATQLQFNSGTLEAALPLVTSSGLSIGGRLNSSASRPTLEGSNMEFTGTSSFFLAGGASGDLALVVNNTTTLSGTLAATITPTTTTPEPATGFIDLSGTGTLIVSGNGSAILDKHFVNGAFTLVIDGTLGGETMQVGSGSTVTGGGTFSGFHINPANYTTNLPPELYRASSVFFDGGSFLAPTGTLTLLSNLTLETGSTTILTIDGATIDTQYDSIAVNVPAGSTGLSYTVNYGGTLTLDFGAAAKNGTYNLFTAGAGVTFARSFDFVSLTGSHTGSLTKSGSVWSGTSGATFSFDESTGVLTVTGGAPVTSALEDWRFANFDSIDNTGEGADGADFDKDGISNLLEYATGTNPKVANASVVTVGTKDNAGEFLTLSFTRINDPALTYTILGGNDLATGLTSTGTTYPGSAADTVVYEDSVSLTTPGVRRFLSLQVSYGTP